MYKYEEIKGYFFGKVKGEIKEKLIMFWEK